MRTTIATTTKSSFKDKATKALSRIKDKATKALSRIKDTVIDKTSDVLSAPSRMRSNDMTKIANDKYDALKLKGVPANVPDKGDQSDPLFRARINAIHDTFDREAVRQNQTAALKRN